MTFSQRAFSKDKAKLIHRALAYQAADLLLPVGSRAGRGFDHGGRLVVCQFLDAALTCYYVTDLRRRTEELVKNRSAARQTQLRDPQDGVLSPPGEGKCAFVLAPPAGRVNGDT